MTLTFLIRLLHCITTPLLFLIAAVPVKIFILSLGSLTTPLLLEWMVSPVWCSRELPVSPILSDIFNLSLSNGRIPDAWKLSRVVPVFKSGDPHTASNYRPISLQPICCKLLEKVIHGSVLQHLNSNNILSDRQFGFLPKSSTTDALTTALHEWYGHLEGNLNLQDSIALTTALHEWYGHLEGRKSIAMALFDLSKAFDRVPHRPLVHKLRAVGVVGLRLSWFRSYLSCRTQLVAIRGVDSNPVPVLSGVPQGSVLGPLPLSMLMISVFSIILSYQFHSWLVLSESSHC